MDMRRKRFRNAAQELANKRSGLTGTAGEMAVAADLLYRGYHVYKSLSGAAPFDLIAYNESTKESYRIECREPSVEYVNSDRLYWNSTANRSLSPDLFAVSCKQGIRYFDTNRKEVTFSDRD